MKAIKIDIKKTWVDIRHHIYREATFKPIMANYRNNEQLPTENITIEETTYFPIKVYEPGRIELTTYLVKKNERQIFIDLMTIQTDTLNSVIEKEVDKKMEIKTYELHANTFKKFRELPWYKRLFIKYEFLFN